MNIRYRQLKAFVLAARSGSFSEAAAALSVTQPSLSIMIKELEQSLGIKLFDRTTRRCELTDGGRLFFREIAGALEHIEHTCGHMIDISHGRRGWLRIATLPSLSPGLVSQALGEYMERWPEVQVVLRERTNRGLHEAVLQREVEIGVCSSEKRDPRLRFEMLYLDRLMAVVPVGHELAKKKGAIGWSSLESYPYVLMRAGTAEDMIRSSTLHVKVALEVDHATTALALVRNGAGITVFLSSVLPFMSMEGLRCLPLRGDLATRKVGIVSFGNETYSKIAVRFIEIFKQHIGRWAAAQSSYGE